MHFDVQIIDNNLGSFNSFLEYSKGKINNQISIKVDNSLKNLDLADLIIINYNKNLIDEIIDVIETKNKYLIVILDDNNTFPTDINFIKYDVLNSPVNYDKLIFKINHYINVIKKDLKLKEEQELSNTVLNNISHPVVLLEDDKMTFVNNYFLNLLDCNCLDEFTLRYSCLNDLFENKIENKVIDTYLNNTHIEGEKVTIIDKFTNRKYFILQKIFLTQKNSHLIIFNDISHEILHKQELFKLLYTDNLTKLPNRAKLIDELQNKTLEIQSASILDINSFKEINDFYGHKVGDEILLQISKLIQEKLLSHSHIKFYKFPADTYCIISSINNKNEFIELIKNIIESIYKKVFLIEQNEIDVRVTAGISHSTKNNKLITADIALKSAKKDNKDFLVFYEELDKFQEYENNMFWTKKLKNALVQDRIDVYFQPLINNKTLEIEKYECLVRLIDENNKVVSPNYFLNISKKSNQYTKVTRIVIEKSFKKFQNFPFEFSVNISYEDIEDEDFLDFIKSMLEKYNLSNKVIFEILENENVKNYDLLIGFIDEIKKLGCKVAIDDFGSGYSNFEHLLKMRVDYLKIDSSLIKNIAIDENSYKITKTIIEFAKSLNLKTIAEYVENEDIFNIVKTLGADYSQGYYFSAPISEPNKISV